MRALLLAAGLLAAGLAGCLQPTPPADEPPGAAQTVALGPYERLRESLADLPCEVASVGAGTSGNVREVALLAYTAFEEPTEHGEVDVRGDWMLVARYGGGGFELVHVADPAAPVHVWSYRPAAQDVGLDVKWMPDNRTAIVGHLGTIDLVDLGPILDAAPVPAGEGAAPEGVLVTQWKHPSPLIPMPVTNMHMLYAKRIAEVDYVFLAPNDDTGVWILKVEGEGDERKLVYVTNVALPLGGGPLGPHDMWVGDDEITGKPFLWVSNGFEGFKAYDVSDPASPRLVSLMPNLVGQGYTHSIMAQKVGERRLVATIAEVGVNTLRVWDATNLQAPLLLAEWWADKTAPTKMQHNLQIVNGTLYLAHYGEGVYVFDLHPLGLPVVGTATLSPIARFQPGGADVWDAVVHQGLLLVNDIGQGTYTVGFGCMSPGDASMTSTG